MRLCELALAATDQFAVEPVMETDAHATFEFALGAPQPDVDVTVIAPDPPPAATLSVVGFTV